MISAIYNSFEHHLPAFVDESIRNGIKEKVRSRDSIKVFFRADDIGVPSKNYEQMMALFLKHRAKLCLAVVPAWMTRQRWEAMSRVVEQGEDLFCWHVHGYRHFNHETEGKKQEFGPARASDQVFNDLSRGRDRLEGIMGKNLTQIFTPPWNRCSLETMEGLKKIGFTGISRSDGAQPSPPRGFKDFPVHVDLHTRKEKKAQKGWQMLLEELLKGMDSSGACGIMIHHMRMNNRAFIFLEYLLELFDGIKQIEIVSFNDLF